MIFGRNEEEMVKELKKTMENKNLVPILMFLKRDD